MGTSETPELSAARSGDGAAAPSGAANVLNVAAYRFVALDGLAELRTRVHAYGQELGLRGSILLAPEGANLFLSAPVDAIEAFLAWLGRVEPRLAQLDVKRSHSDSPAFDRFKVKLKAEIISFRDPTTSPLQRQADSVTPQTLRRWLQRGADDAGKLLLLLDTRNREETAWGSFAGAELLPIDRFTELPDAVAERAGAWRGKRVVSFCTGGIRCEKAALWLQDHGFEDVLQLQGGILGYFEHVGGAGYEGACFVFDQRVALDPDLQPVALPSAAQDDALTAAA